MNLEPTPCYETDQGALAWMESASTIALRADTIERKHAERVSRESQERFRIVADSAPVLIWMTGLVFFHCLRQ